MFYEVRGEGFPVVVMHSYSLEHRSMMAYLEPVFAEHSGYKRYYLDLPGMGRTKGEDWMQSSDDMLQAVLNFLDETLPGQPFLLVGESYGGYMAQGIVYQRPHLVAGIALICPMVEPEMSKRERPAHTVLTQDEDFLATLPEGDDKAAFQRLNVVQTPEVWTRFERDVLAGARLYNPAFTQRIRQNFGYSFDVRHLPEPFGKPALILLGRQDSVAGYRDHLQILEQYPRAAFAILDRAGHNVALEQQALVTAHLHDWLKRVSLELNQA
ncbi:hypothetical protein CBW65_02970 [Tumebacillus avium]|uniref:Serine aminopeptidase S33 domain-containing protein n=1 Tax=Tumebacillus avium TaxID=1903704 RepID=A0A1Y0IKU0_9BACL|nr:alpha/beta hydrolase [Tumebacillus avium]ARU60135.1 hypothetical protein CBW65_02970 [Tumebacillus avium]